VYVQRRDLADISLKFTVVFFVKYFEHFALALMINRLYIRRLCGIVHRHFFDDGAAIGVRQIIRI